MKKFCKGLRGFTLVEMVIVIAVIALLSTVVLRGQSGVQQSARDAKRIADIKTIQTYLEQYANKCGHYPGAVSGTPPCLVGTLSATTEALWKSDFAKSLENNIGIIGVPQDPTTGKTYTYVSNDPNTTYTLTAILENAGHNALNTSSCPDIAKAYCVQP